MGVETINTSLAVVFKGQFPEIKDVSVDGETYLFSNLSTGKKALIAPSERVFVRLIKKSLKFQPAVLTDDEAEELLQITLQKMRAWEKARYKAKIKALRDRVGISRSRVKSCLDEGEKCLDAADKFKELAKKHEKERTSRQKELDEALEGFYELFPEEKPKSHAKSKKTESGKGPQKKTKKKVKK